MQTKERKVRVTFLNEISGDEAFNILALEIAKKIHEEKMREIDELCRKELNSKRKKVKKWHIQNSM